MAAAPKVGMSDNIFEESVLTPGAQKIGAVVSMQVATILASASDTNTATPS
jgi:hypothetical protein